jgi:hypothetical protein
MEGSPCSGAGDPPPPRQALRRALPLARRALMTARPPRVFMRARKPWVRLRLISLGWKVRFMLAVLSGSEVVEQKGSECTVLELFLSMEKTRLATRAVARSDLTPRCELAVHLPTAGRPQGLHHGGPETPGLPRAAKRLPSGPVIVRMFRHGFTRRRPVRRRPGSLPTASTPGTPCPINSHKTASRWSGVTASTGWKTN